MDLQTLIDNFVVAVASLSEKLETAKAKDFIAELTAIAEQAEAGINPEDMGPDNEEVIRIRYEGALTKINQLEAKFDGPTNQYAIESNIYAGNGDKKLAKLTQESVEYIVGQKKIAFNLLEDFIQASGLNMDTSVSPYIISDTDSNELLGTYDVSTAIITAADNGEEVIFDSELNEDDGFFPVDKSNVEEGAGGDREDQDRIWDGMNTDYAEANAEPIVYPEFKKGDKVAIHQDSTGDKVIWEAVVDERTDNGMNDNFYIMKELKGPNPADDLTWHAKHIELLETIPAADRLASDDLIDQMPVEEESDGVEEMLTPEDEDRVRGIHDEEEAKEDELEDELEVTLTQADEDRVREIHAEELAARDEEVYTDDPEVAITLDMDDDEELAGFEIEDDPDAFIEDEEVPVTIEEEEDEKVSYAEEGDNEFNDAKNTYKKMAFQKIKAFNFEEAAAENFGEGAEFTDAFIEAGDDFNKIDKVFSLMENTLGQGEIEFWVKSGVEYATIIPNAITEEDEDVDFNVEDDTELEDDADEEDIIEVDDDEAEAEDEDIIDVDDDEVIEDEPQAEDFEADEDEGALVANLTSGFEIAAKNGAAFSFADDISEESVTDWATSTLGDPELLKEAANKFGLPLGSNSSEDAKTKKEFYIKDFLGDVIKHSELLVDELENISDSLNVGEAVDELAEDEEGEEPVEGEEEAPVEGEEEAPAEDEEDEDW